MSDANGTWYLNGRRRPSRRRIRPWVVLTVPVLALLFQTYAPLFMGLFGWLELPLLVTIYFAMGRRSPVSGLLIGAAIGLGQDALSHGPIGLTGMVKTLAGYAASVLGLRFETENPLVRFASGVLFCLGHESLLWTLRRTLLGEESYAAPLPAIAAAVINGALAVPLFHLLDKLRENP